jgi:high-affinity iron transporter
VLFLYGVAAGGGTEAGAMFAGGLLGVAAGALTGFALYAGLLRIPLRWFFTVTGLLVLFLAAGMASQAARLLVQADLLPALAVPLWDTSGWLPDGSTLGTLLHSLVGYESRPSGIQIGFYVAVLGAIAAGMRWVGGRHAHRRPRPQVSH